MWGFDGERGVAPVVGTILMVAVVVVLAASVAVFALAIGQPGGDPTPTVAFDFDYRAGGPGDSDELVISHVAGPELAADEVILVVEGVKWRTGGGGWNDQSHAGYLDDPARFTWDQLQSTDGDTIGAGASFSVRTEAGEHGADQIRLDESTITLVHDGETETVLRRWSGSDA